MNEFDMRTVKKLILKGKWFLSDHALERLLERNLRIVDVITSILNGEILEDYSDDPRGHSVLIIGKKDDIFIHTVCGLKDENLVIITAYEPKLPKWTDERTRGGKENE